MRVDQFVVVAVMIVVVTGYALETNEADRTFSTATEVKSYIHPLMLFSYVHPLARVHIPENGACCGRVLCLLCCCCSCCY